MSDEIDLFARTLGRMERVIASSVGAGRSIDDAWDQDRWRRELGADLPGAEDLLVSVRARLAAVRSAGDVHAAFSMMLARLDAVRQRIA